MIGAAAATGISLIIQVLAVVKVGKHVGTIRITASTESAETEKTEIEVIQPLMQNWRGTAPFISCGETWQSLRNERISKNRVAPPINRGRNWGGTQEDRITGMIRLILYVVP